MLQYIMADVLPLSPRLKKYCLTNPDFLLKVSVTNSEGLDGEAGEKFNLVMHDLRMGGAWKRTSSGRLKETERVLIKYLAAAHEQQVTLLDIGASNGITTWEAIKELRKHLGVEIKAVLADLYLYLLRFRRGPVVEYRTGDGEPVMVRVGRLGLRLAKHRRTVQEATDPLVALYFRMENFRNNMRLETKIPLIHPLTRAEAAITAVEMNCLERKNEFLNSLEAVRASNVLNNDYFTSDQIRTAVSHLHAYLKPGGCLIVSRNNDVAGGEVERGTVWMRRPRNFERVEDFNDGSEVSGIVDDWTL